MRVLILGGTLFIGRRIALELLAGGDDVMVVHRGAFLISGNGSASGGSPASGSGSGSGVGQPAGLRAEQRLGQRQRHRGFRGGGEPLRRVADLG